MSSTFSLTGRLYGTPRTNIVRGVSPPGETSRVNFTVGSYDSYKKEMSYFYLVAFGKTAELVMRFFTQKRCVNVIGRLDNSVYKKEGQERESRSVSLVANSVTFPSDGDGVEPISSLFKKADAEPAPAPQKTPEDPEDLPF